MVIIDTILNIETKTLRMVGKSLSNTGNIQLQRQRWILMMHPEINGCFQFILLHG